MKTASIISIGNEILSGHTVDTNAAYLSGRLLSVGISTKSFYTVGDDADSIKRALALAEADGDIVLATGGLGPTDDDVTRQGFAEFLGVKLQFQDGLSEKIRDFFSRLGLMMPATGKVQAYIPAGARAVDNNIGTAPGIGVEKQGKLFYALPGVPTEMEKMFEQSVLPALSPLAENQAVVVRKLRCFGTGESNIAQILGPVMQRGRNPQVNSTAGFGVITLHIISTAKDKTQARQMADDDEKVLRQRLGELGFAAGEQNLAQVVGERLSKENKTIAVAESCTGGILAGMLTDAPGASRYFTHGWVTYSNDAKTSELGVSSEMIEQFGAVSEQVARAMARGARGAAGADYAVGITGIAGPTGATEQKPAGLVYISIDCDKICVTERLVFSGDRSDVRIRAANTALNMLRLQLQN